YELYAGLSYKIISGKIWYSPDFANAGESAWYGELNAGIPLPAEFALNLHAGYNFGDYWKPENSDDLYDAFYDYSVGIGRSFGHFDFEVKYIDGSDLKNTDCSRSGVECIDDVLSSESKAFFSVSTTFPWSKADE
ncbi:MAG: TorF family putative porin, partial [Gammaproteobacteria bacterium]